MISNRLKQIRKSQETFTPEEDRAAGLLGESLALEAIQRSKKGLKGKTAVFEGVRVPKSSGRGKYEIDILLVSQYGVIAFEVKHWGGSLERSGGQWRQSRREQSKYFSDPVPLLEQKTNDLHRWLVGRGFFISKADLHYRVLLTNSNVSLSKELESNSKVATLANINESIRTLCGHGNLKFWQKPKQKPWDHKSLIAQLKVLPSWDELLLNGGRKSWGDILGFSLRIKGENSLLRSEVKSVKVKIFRSWLGFFLSPRLVVVDWKGQSRTIPFREDHRVLLRHGGQAKEEEIPLIHLVSVNLGWQDQSYYND